LIKFEKARAKAESRLALLLLFSLDENNMLAVQKDAKKVKQVRKRKVTPKKVEQVTSEKKKEKGPVPAPASQQTAPAPEETKKEIENFIEFRVGERVWCKYEGKLWNCKVCLDQRAF
jgi:hypothetical protein